MLDALSGCHFALSRCLALVKSSMRLIRKEGDDKLHVSEVALMIVFILMSMSMSMSVTLAGVFRTPTCPQAYSVNGVAVGKDSE